jgi:hypothetical protein
LDADMCFELAREVLTSLEANGWHVPDELRTDPRLQPAGAHVAAEPMS